MLRLRDIMTRDVLTVSPETSVRDALALFTTKHISGAPVMANGSLVGVVSLTDLAELVASAPAIPREREDPLEDIDDSVGLDVLPDPDPMPAAYFADMWEDAGADVTERIADSDGPEWDALAAHTVSEAMNRQVYALASDTPVDRCADFMRQKGIHRVLVKDRDALVGLVSTMDITVAVADQKLTSRVLTFGHPARHGQVT